MKWHVSFEGTADSSDTAGKAILELCHTGLVTTDQWHKNVSFSTKREINADEYLLLLGIVKKYFPNVEVNERRQTP